MLESEYQAHLIKQIKRLLPGAMVLKNDPNYVQGIPDLTVLYKDKWALLEVKPSAEAKERPNQRWYIEQATGFGAFIYPENEQEVLLALQRSLAG